jgi:hypothetical protein
MDLVELSRRSGVAPRRLRYAIYHTLAPGVSKVDVGRGSVRAFTNFEGFCIALAATFLDAGVKRDAVASAFYTLAGRYGRETAVGDIPLFRIFSTGGRTMAEVRAGDGRYFRALAGATAGRRSVDTGWLPGKGVPDPPPNYEPTVMIAADVQRLAAALHER